MANVASVLKEEITRLARKEIRTETEGLKKLSAQYRSEIIALKRRVADLEKQMARLGKVISKTSKVKEETGVPTKIRFTVKGFKSLRQKLGLSAAEMGALVDASAPTIYNWEAGNSKPREQQLVHIAKLRGLGKREVGAMLEKLA